jgi:hypothetical protein
LIRITLTESDSDYQGTTLVIKLDPDVTLFQAKALAKRIKQLADKKLKVEVETDEEVVYVKKLAH